MATTRIRRLDAYVFRAVQLNALKPRARRRRLESLDALPVEPASDSREEDEPGLSPFALEEAMEGLPLDQQVVLRMKYYLGYTFRQIGQALSVSSNTASSRCRYGLASLRRALEKQTPNDT